MPCLCQGAALHYADGANGVKDFDMWSFYAEHPDGPFPARWRRPADFGPSKSGRFPGDPAHYQGRRVDLMGRSLKVPLDADPAEALRGYLSAAETASAKALAAKPVVLIVPSNPRRRDRLASRRTILTAPTRPPELRHS